MTHGEEQTIRNVIARLKAERLGAADGVLDSIVPFDTPDGRTGRLYIDTWIIAPLQMLLPESRNVKTALAMSRPPGHG